MNRKKSVTVKRKKKAAKSVSRKTLVKNVTKKIARKLVKRVSVRKKPKTSPVLGKVVHYYDRIGVAVLELRGTITLGDNVCFRRADDEFCQNVDSLQIDHVAVRSAKKGQDVGMKVMRQAEPGTLVLRA